MAELSIILVDDAIVRDWEPFALTRPAGELLYGALTFRRRAELIFQGQCTAHLVEEHLLGFEETGAPPVQLTPDEQAQVDRLFLLSRAVPAWSAQQEWTRPSRSGPIRVGEQTAGWFVAAGDLSPELDTLRNPVGATLEPVARIEGRLLDHVWAMIPTSHEQVSLDVAALHPEGVATALPAGVHQWGEHPVILGDGARLEPGCALDTTDGPIWIDRGSTIRAFTRLAGPSYIGPDNVLLGGSIGPVSTGPVCKIAGEVAESICLGYTNKQHDGHLGHAYLGRWVNLGAETTNSDLKNNYGTVRLWTPDGYRDTGEIKMGCLLGDHVKTGIGLSLNTGTIIGAGSNVWGSELPPTFVAPFSWGTGSQLHEYRLDKFLKVTERAMGRRNVALSDSMRGQLAHAWQRSARWRAGAGPVSP